MIVTFSNLDFSEFYEVILIVSQEVTSWVASDNVSIDLLYCYDNYN